MPKRFATSIDLMGLALINACLNPLTSDPTGLGAGDTGRVWYNTTLNGGTLKVWTGTAALDLRARSTHTGTITASVVSDFAAAVQALQWSSMAQPTAAVPMGSQNFSGLSTATASGQAVEYAQFQNAIAAVQSGMDFKAPPAEVVVTTNMSLTAPGATINGRTMQVGDTVLLTGQTTASQNGIYLWNSSTSLTRRADSTAAGSIYSGTMISVGAADSANPDTIWMQVTVGTGTNSSIVVGTDSQSWIKPFTPTTYTQGNGITILSNVIAVVAAGSGGAADQAIAAKTGLIVDSAGVYLDPAAGVRKVYGTIPAASSGIYSVSGTTVTIADGISNINKKFVLKAGAAPQTIGGVTPATGEEIETQNIASTTNTITYLPAAPTTNAWTYEILG